MMNSIIWTALIIMALTFCVNTKKVSKSARNTTHAFFNLSLIALVLAIIGRIWGF